MYKEREPNGVAQVSIALCAASTLTAAALNLTQNWLPRWACRNVEGSNLMLSLLCLRDLELNCLFCLRLAQVVLFHEREHRAALMQAPQRRKELHMRNEREVG